MNRLPPASIALGAWRAAVVLLARALPVESPAFCAALGALSLAAGAGLIPRLVSAAAAVPLMGEALRVHPLGSRGLRAAQWALEGGAYASALVSQARCLQLCHPRFYDPHERPPRVRSRRAPPGGIVVAGMPVSRDDLCTSVLVTGVTGSSKTAGILMPALAQLFAAHNREDGEAGGFEKLGAFIPEVKGDLVDGCIYLAHESGRCVSRDVRVLTPGSRIPAVRLRDERGRFWFLAARGGSGGSDAGDWLARDGRPPPPSAFEEPERFEALRRGSVRPLLGARPRFVGWRWEGGRLWRVARTVARDRVDPLDGGPGGRRWADPPSSLELDGIVHLDDGLHYNLLDERLPAAEAAERLTRLAAMARGPASRGENDYFYEQGRKLAAACIRLHRAVEPAPCTVADVVRLATRDERLEAALAALEERLRAPGPEGPRDAAALEDLLAFFRGEWQRMVADGKTANVIKSTLSAAFDLFLQDPDLARTFCRPSTFSFEDAAQSGKIVALVPGERYEQLGRLLGAACKTDFQSAMLARGGRPGLNRSRLVLYFADECHKYASSGSSTAGDPYFMNLSRSNNVANVCATQSYAWIVEVLGREAANVYLSAFGVQFWLQQTDPETCRRAAEICGSAVREKVVAEHDFDLGGLRSALGGGGGLALRRRVREEERPRFRPEDFALLDVGEVIAYNKGRPGRGDKVARGRAAYHFCTRRPAGEAAVRARVREYYREVLENLSCERGLSGMWESGEGSA